MPKVSSGSTSTPTRSKKASLFVFIYDDKRVLASRKTCYNEAIRDCRKLFSEISANHKITFHTKELPICAGVLTAISEDVWEEVVGDITSVIVRAEERVQSQAQAIPGVVARNRGYLTVTVERGDGERCEIRGLRPETQVKKIYSAVVKRWGRSIDGWRLMYEGDICLPYQTIESMEIEDGDTLHLLVEQKGGKPVIYLFSPETIEAEVKLSLIPQWNLSAIYPVVPIKPRTARSNEQVAWRVRTHVNGDLTELTTGLDVAYLFWEAHTDSTVPPSPPASPIHGESNRGLTEHFNPNEAVLNDANSVVMPVAKSTPYLDKALAALGLHTEARTSFITYWLPSILKHKHLAFRFLPQASYEEAAPLEIAPSPDVITRVFMIFQGLAEQELQDWTTASSRASEDVTRWRKVVGVDLERTLDANLFRVLEWGGMEVLRPSST
ncbi:hypothetical protein M413DRAFT_448413 [Hebeloma cylindrosporum]|uniref:Ubiquitin-like domain-containing protein n=1 Tax=Hebeloma cylindrosporum TaxID=76867 RepID=A0A0C2Y9D4_HEBCY|nr:hypothetical protein M413DRAFT_448413 [Hebeloma cylindrosporum h7]